MAQPAAAEAAAARRRRRRSKGIARAMLGEKVGEGGEEIIDPGREKVQLQLARIGEEYKNWEKYQNYYLYVNQSILPFPNRQLSTVVHAVKRGR